MRGKGGARTHRTGAHGAGRGAPGAEYGDKDNADLATRFNIKADDLPQYRLFQKGAADAPVPYAGEKKAAGFLQFVQEWAGAWVGLPGQVKEMDDLAKELATCAPRCHRTCAPARPSEAPLNARRARGRSSDKTAVVKKAEGVAAAIDAKSADAAKYYVKVMKKVVEGGAGFIGKETKRLQKMMDDGSVKADKKEQFGRRLNALSSFA